MADAKFSFQEKGKMYHPAWIAPEVNYLLHHHQPCPPHHQHHRHLLLRRCQKARQTSMCGPRICGAMLFFFGSSPQGKSLILILKYCFLGLKMMIWMQKAKEKRQLGREVINFGPQTIGQTLASSTRSCFPNTIYSLITFSSFVPFSSYLEHIVNRISLSPQIYFFREEPFGDLSPMEAGMKVGLPLRMNNPNKMTNNSISDVKNQT